MGEEARWWLEWQRTLETSGRNICRTQSAQRPILQKIQDKESRTLLLPSVTCWVTFDQAGNQWARKTFDKVYLGKPEEHKTGKVDNQWSEGRDVYGRFLSTDS